MKNTEKLRTYFYICMDATSSVFWSQVIGHLSVLRQEKGMSFNLIAGGNLKKGQPLFSEEKRKEIEQEIQGKLIEITYSNKVCGLLRVLWNVVCLFIPSLLRGEKVVLHCRGKDGGLIGSLANLICLGRLKIIYDVRGDIIGEQFYYLNKKGSKENPLSKIKIWFAYNYLSLIERFCGLQARYIFFVSNPLMKVFKERHKTLSKKQSFVFPSASSERIFYYSKELRKEIRKELQVYDDEIVLVYSGSLKRYQLFEKSVEIVKLIKEKLLKVKFLVVVPEQDFLECDEILKRSDLKDWIGRSAKYRDVVKYLNAGDVGIILREDLPINHSASPTKFSEFVLCGLPLIISAGIGDTEDFVRENNCGVIVDKSFNLEKSVLEFVDFWGTISKDLNTFRENLIASARNYYSKERLAEKYYNIYLSI